MGEAAGKDKNSDSYSDYGSNRKYEDIKLADLRYAVDYRTRKNNLFESDTPNKFVLRDEKEWVKAVMISCSGDMHFMGKSKYRQLVITKRHPIFADRDTDVSTGTEQMGCALSLKKFSVLPSWQAKIHRGMNFISCKNTELACLMLVTGIRNPKNHWGHPLLKWGNSVDHSALVARRDRKDLIAQQVEALIRYFKEVFKL